MTTAASAASPAWITSQRRDRGDCQQCGIRPYTTEWAGTGLLLCQDCCDQRQAAYIERIPGKGQPS